MKDLKIFNMSVSKFKIDYFLETKRLIGEFLAEIKAGFWANTTISVMTFDLARKYYFEHLKDKPQEYKVRMFKEYFAVQTVEDKHLIKIREIEIRFIICFE